MLKTVSSITNAIGALNYKGTWNATTNTPTIVSATGTKGDYYVVSVAGTTTIDGISNWGVGDWIVFNGAAWQRVEGGADLNGVNLSVSGTTTLSGLTASTALALDANKNVVSVTNTGTGNNVLTTGPTLTSPKIVTDISDTNGNEILGLTPTASAVNNLYIQNSATGNDVKVASQGSDSNIPIRIAAKASTGAGLIYLASDQGGDAEYRVTGGSVGYIGMYSAFGATRLITYKGNAGSASMGFYDIDAAATRLSIDGAGAVNIPGALSKGSGSFRIPHPLPELSETHDLVHSFIEGPMADLIYRGRAQLENGLATVNIDQAAGMTEGTFVLLCRNVQCFTSNEEDWHRVRGKVQGNILTIECEDQTCNDTISWMVIGERQDKHMMETDWTDETGRVIVEPLKPPPLVIEMLPNQDASVE